MTRLTKLLAQEFQMIRATVMMPGAGGAVYQTALPMNRCLTVGDCITSANAMFFARMDADGKLRVYRGAPGQADHDCLWQTQREPASGAYFALVQSDGNFCIYRGADLAHNDGWHWGTQMTADGGQFHAQLRDDGEFCILGGAGLDDAGEIVWRSGVADPVVSIDEIHALEYMLASAELLLARPADLYRETVRNSSAHTQTSMISGSVAVSDSASWSDELGTSVSAAAGFKGPVPMVSGRKVVMSADAGHVFMRGASTTVARNWGFNAPAAVPANSAMTCVVAATRSAIAVPYVLTGVFTLASGARVTGSVNGSYRGSNCHDLSVALTLDTEPSGAVTISRPLVQVAAAQ